jgi:hypothetical protein
MGIVGALFVILLSASGLILHYSPDLQLDNRFISSSSLLSWYRIEVPEIALSYSAGDQYASLIADAIYFNESRLPGSFTSLSGIVAAESGYAIATRNQLILLTEAGELIEILGSLVGVPAGIDRIGNSSVGEVYLELDSQVLAADLDALTWIDSNSQQSRVSWSSSEALDRQLAEQIQDDYGDSLLSWERLVLDIHSGRLLGGIGVVLVDLMAILFMLMAGTGVWIWSTRRS